MLVRCVNLVRLFDELGEDFPTLCHFTRAKKAGADGLAEAARRFGGSIFVLPPEAAKPGLAERLRGMALDKLTAQLGAPVLVAQ